MYLTKENKLKNIILIGDKVLIKPLEPSMKTTSGLYLPPGVHEKEKVQKGYVVKTGPGYLLHESGADESWKGEDEKIKYIPLQTKVGDLAIFIISMSSEIIYKNEKYFIVPQNSILMLEREEDIF